MTQATQIEVGQIVAFSAGEYSDYRIGCFAKVLKPINAGVWEAMRVACSEIPSWGDEDDKYFEESKAAPWLIANGYIDEIDYTELHLGEYGSLPDWSEA